MSILSNFAADEVDQPSTKKSRIENTFELSLLDQLKKFTVIVADTGEFRF